MREPRIRHQLFLPPSLSERLEALARQPGTSKSAILIALQFRRYSRSQVYIFDKGFSARAAVLAMGGAHHALGHGADGGDALAFQPLRRINNQIKALQNQAQSLINQAKNLTTINFPELQVVTRTLQQIDQLMGQAQGIQFRVANLDQQFRSMFPTSFDQLLTNNQHAVDARARLDTSMAAYKQTMTVQAQVVENIAADQTTLNGIVSRSQGSEGGLQVAQATNQLLALVAKQQFQLQTLMAAQFHADAIERATRTNLPLGSPLDPNLGSHPQTETRP